MKLIPGHGFLPCLAAITTLTLMASAAHAQMINDGLQTADTAKSMTAKKANAATDTVGAKIFRLYETILGRQPDIPGLLLQTQAFENGTPLATIASEMLASPEFVDKFGAITLLDGGFITQMYVNGLHRNPEPAGLAFYANLLNTGTDRGTVATFISQSPEAINLWAPFD